MKVANVLVEWDVSPSEDVASRVITITTSEGVQTQTVNPDVGQITVRVKASSDVTIQTKVIDHDGNETLSATFQYAVGDLIAPLPDVNFRARVVSVDDVADEPAAPPDDRGSV